MPLDNPLGFGATDVLEVALGILLLCFVFLRPIIVPGLVTLAHRTVWCMLALFLVPIILRVMLLPNHPVPLPDVFDEFGHLFVAGTLGHLRLANPMHPMHRFFETLFILQEPTYSSIYPLGQGLMLAAGQFFFHLPWAGVVVTTGALCALVYWMLRAWVSPEWALVGGALAVIGFGPLNGWMNCYWGGSLAACAGCLVFGALPRIVAIARWRDGVLLGAGVGIHLLTRPYESVLLVFSAAVFLAMARRWPVRPLAASGALILCAGGLILAQDRSVTGNWFLMPYQLSQAQYGVPMALTFQSEPQPHRELTPEQRLEYQSQRSFRNSATETLASYLSRLEYRVRYYRFFFLPPLYVALAAFLFAYRTSYWSWAILTCLIFALGSNFYPMFQVHYVAALTPIFLMMSVQGLVYLSRTRAGAAVAALICFFCAAHFVFWYGLHAIENNSVSSAMRRYETWNSIDHQGGRRSAVHEQLARMQGPLLVFVHYSPQHLFQQEWVYNEPDIDSARVVLARDLGAQDNQNLIRYFPKRTAFMLDPDAEPPELTPYVPEPPPVQSAQPATPQPEATKPAVKPTQPMLRFEHVK